MALDQQDIMDAIYTRLSGDHEFNTALGGTDSAAGRIYDTEAPANRRGAEPISTSVLPLCLFTLISGIPIPTFDDSDLWRMILQVDLFGIRGVTNGVKAVRDIADHLLARLDRVSLSVTGFNKVAAFNQDQGAPVIEEDVIRQTSQWLILASG